MLRHPGWLLGAILLVVSYPARAVTPDEPSLPIQLVFQGLYCGRDGAPVQWLGDRLAVVRVLGRVRHNRTRTSLVLRQLDFTRQGVVLIRMGTRFPAGSAVVLDQTTASVISNALQIRVRWQESPSGFRAAPALTSPCLLAAVPRGSYIEVTVVDTSGAVYGCAGLPERHVAACVDSAVDSLTEHATTELRHRQ